MTFNPFAFLSPSDDSLFMLGATGTVPIAGSGRWWTLCTASFLHGGILHLLFNMAALRQLGPFVLAEFGSNRFIIIYILAGVMGFITSFIAGISFTIGASASICGLIGAILYYGKSRGGLYGQAIFKQSSGWVLGLILFGLLLPGINNWAHGGGLMTGILLGYVLGYKEKGRGNNYHHLAAVLLVMLTLTSFVWALFQALPFLSVGVTAGIVYTEPAVHADHFMNER